MLEQAGSGDGVQVLFFTEKAAIEKILKFVVAGNTTQMNDPAFVEELKAWIRFGRDEAIRTGDGLFSGSTGNPSVPRWLGSLLFGMLFTPKSENNKYARHVRSSAARPGIPPRRRDQYLRHEHRQSARYPVRASPSWR